MEKKYFFSSQTNEMMLAGKRNYWNYSLHFFFFLISSNTQYFCYIWSLEDIITEKILTFYIILMICSSLSLTAGFYKHFNIYVFLYWNFPIGGKLKHIFWAINYSRHLKILRCREFKWRAHSISAPRFYCIVCDKALICNHKTR